jgi:small subunit ribosomal protein S1
MPDRKDEGESFAALFERSGAMQPNVRRFRQGDRLDVRVVAVSREAIFADLGSKQEGYFDRAELVDPTGKLTVDVGAMISAIVHSIDDGTGQVRLSPVFVRRASSAPGEADSGAAIPVAKSGPLLIEGARVRGKVTGVERYGVFVQISGTSGRGGRGLVPTAETATPRGADLKKHFTVGQELDAKILAIDPEGKIRLSIAAAKADEERGEFEAYLSTGEPPPADAPAAGEGEPGGKKPGAKPKKPEPRGFGTLGDLLSKKKK